MGAELRDRSELTKTVLRALRHSATRNTLPVATSDGVRPIIVTLPSDRVGEVIVRVARQGGVANVMLETVEGIVAVGFRARPVPASDDRPDVHEDITMGMLMVLLDSATEPLTLTVGASSDAASMQASSPMAVPI